MLPLSRTHLPRSDDQDVIAALVDEEDDQMTPIFSSAQRRVDIFSSDISTLDPADAGMAPEYFLNFRLAYVMLLFSFSTTLRSQMLPAILTGASQTVCT